MALTRLAMFRLAWESRHHEGVSHHESSPSDAPCANSRSNEPKLTLNKTSIPYRHSLFKNWNGSIINLILHHVHHRCSQIKSLNAYPVRACALDLAMMAPHDGAHRTPPVMAHGSTEIATFSLLLRPQAVNGEETLKMEEPFSNFIFFYPNGP